MATSHRRRGPAARAARAWPGPGAARSAPAPAPASPPSARVVPADRERLAAGQRKSGAGAGGRHRDREQGPAPARARATRARSGRDPRVEPGDRQVARLQEAHAAGRRPRRACSRDRRWRIRPARRWDISRRAGASSRSTASSHAGRPAGSPVPAGRGCGRPAARCARFPPPRAATPSSFAGSAR